MSRAGIWLHRFASRVYGRTTMERLIEPILADMRYEHEQAVERGQRWRSRQARTAGYLGFWRAVLLHAAASVPGAVLGVAAANGWLMGRTVAIVSVTFVGLTAMMVLPSLLPMLPIWPASSGRLAMYLAPQAMFLAFPIALSVGIAYGCRGRRPSWRIVAPVLILAICGTAAAFATREWLIPDAGQAFRLSFIPEGGSLARGPVEMALSELGARIDALRAAGSVAEGARVWRLYHLHWALCFASIALSLLGLGMSTFSGRRTLAVAIGVATPVAYWACIAYVDAGAMRGALHPAFAWLPNGVFAGLGILLLRLRSSHPERAPAAH